MDDIQLKTCTGCREIFPATSEWFYHQRGTFDGLRPDCKGCQRDRQARYRVGHRKEATERSRQWYVEHADETKKRKRQYRIDHLEEVRARDRRQHKHYTKKAAEYQRQYRIRHRGEREEYCHQWKRTHPEAVRASSNRRRARKLAAGGDHTAEDLQRQYNIQNGRCWWCLKKLGDDWEEDHLIPLARNGHNGADNIVLSCPKCNQSKGAKTPDEWAGRLF